jgi:hypothetical protein
LVICESQFSQKSHALTIFELPAVELRRMLQANTVLPRQLKDLEKKYDSKFKMVFDAIRQLMTPPARKPRKIGFKVQKSEK